MKKWFSTAIFASSLLFSAVSFAAIDVKNPYKLIDGLSDQIFSELKANEAKYQANPDLLRGLVEKELMPYVNARYAAFKVLGPLVKKATVEQRNAFSAAFEEYLVSVYAQVLTRYTDQKINVEAPKPIPSGRSIVSANVEIIEPSRPPINLDFKLRQNTKTKDWQAFDVQVEGVSMLDTKASELRGPLRQDGIDKVTNDLIKLAKAPITKAKNQ